MLRRPTCDGRRQPTGRCTHCGRYTYGRAAVCRRRRCPGYAPLWAGDQRRKLFENLAVYEGESVVLLAVTAPGADRLPWDESHCRPLGDHRHSGSLGCRVHPVAAREWNQSASDRWRRLHRRAYQAVRRHGVRCTLLVGPSSASGVESSMSTRFSASPHRPSAMRRTCTPATWSGSPRSMASALQSAACASSQARRRRRTCPRTSSPARGARRPSKSR